MLLNRIAAWADEQSRRSPWTNVYGVGRTLIALGTLLTLLLSHSSSIFVPTVDKPVAVACGGYAQLSLFCQVGAGQLEAARWAAAVILLLVVIGWRPRLTGVLHWYVAWSFMVSATLVDGGDQVAAILALLLVPVTLSDPRKWHWSSAPDRGARGDARWLGALGAISCILVVRLQVAVIYFHAAIGKFAVEEWTDGTVLYYWFTHSYFGAPDWLRPLVSLLVDNAVLLPLMTWGVLALEALLFAGLIADKRYWPPLLLLGIGMHLGIALIHGIVSFSIIMFGALVLFLRPFEREFRLPAALRIRSAAAAEPESVAPVPIARGAREVLEGAV